MRGVKDRLFHGRLYLVAGFALLVAAAVDAALVKTLHAPAVQAASGKPAAAITVDYPQDESIFPPEITPPTFLWRDAAPDAKTWRIDVTFAGRVKALHVQSQGEGMRIGEIDPRCVSDTNKPPFLTPEQGAAHTWKPGVAEWECIKRHSVSRAATVTFTGLDVAGRAV